DDLFSLLDGREYQKDNNLLFKLKPDISFSWAYDILHKTGPEGWRKRSDKSKANELGKDTLKIIAVGDSCTFGLGCPSFKTYTAILENLINSSTRYKAKVYNYGVPGYTSFQCRKLLEEVMPVLEPYAVICYIGANDGARALEYSDKEYYEILQANNKSFIFRLIKNSKVFNLLKTLRYRRQISEIKKAIGQLSQNVDWFSFSFPDLVDKFEERGVRLPSNIFNKKRVSLEEFRENIKSMKQLTQNYDAFFVYVPNVWNNGKSYSYAEDYLIFDFLDVMTQIKKYRIEDVYIDSVHLSEKGHSVIAGMIFDRLFGGDKSLAFFNSN
ncbi:MAG: SGNH/GDSL hydrolase family protein, partial [Candidatus Omnitrophica bacterium]|nr:SGNH/GDSL hydrolase family protein [Candidatus Omnitrophota bacterium]